MSKRHPEVIPALIELSISRKGKKLKRWKCPQMNERLSQRSIVRAI